MPQNKNALIRYLTLDKCFSNRGKYFSIEDLLNEVNLKLLEENEDTTGIKLRQLRNDIRFLKSEEGYKAPIETFKHLGKFVYQYNDPNFSIQNSPITQNESEQLKHTLQILKRFEGQPGFDWIKETMPVLEDKFGLKNSNKVAISFESNIDYEGYFNIAPLFNAIVNEQVLKIQYEPFSKDAFNCEFHPYHLKQFNNRWFVIGFNKTSGYNNTIFALDRIKSIEETFVDYIKNDTNWEDYFSDFIGVSKTDNSPCEVKLIFKAERAPYVKTKPIHQTQKHRVLDNNDLEVRISVIPNKELEALILSFGEMVEVVSPKELRDTVMQSLKKAINNY